MQYVTLYVKIHLICTKYTERQKLPDREFSGNSLCPRVRLDPGQMKRNLNAC